MWQYRVSGCPCGESGNTDDSEGANKATGGLRNGKMQQMSQVFVELSLFVGPLSRVRPRNGILALVVLVVVVLVPLRSEFIGEL